MADLTPQAFAEKWSRMALSERSPYHQHFRDLCAMLGQPTPTDVDPDGSFYTFEKGVEKSGGGKGFADVWRKGFFAFEYKGRHKDLTAAYSQLLLYREDLENPPLLVVTDTDRFEVHTNFTGTVKRVHAFANAELPRAARDVRHPPLRCAGPGHPHAPHEAFRIAEDLDAPTCVNQARPS
jgi:hypothetical protein